jgi:hypothetical protein
MNRNNILVLLMLILASCINLKSQCPPSSTCSNTWTTDVHYMGELLDEFGFRATATISYRENCDGDFEYIIDNISISENSFFMEEFQIHQFSYSFLTEMVSVDYFMTNRAFGNDNNQIPNFPNTTKRIFVYTAGCGIWLRCSYKLPSPLIKVCDTPWNGTHPDYENGTDRWVDHWKWHSCGNICCKKEYVLTSANGRNIVQSVTKSRYSGSEECSGQGDFFGARPLPTDSVVELPCEDGC